MLFIIYSGRQYQIRWPYPIGLPLHLLLVPPGTNIKQNVLLVLWTIMFFIFFRLIWIIKKARWRLYCSEVGDGLFQYAWGSLNFIFFSSDLGIAHLYRFKIIETKLRRSCWNNTNKPSHYYQGHICLFIEYCFEEKKSSIYSAHRRHHTWASGGGGISPAVYKEILVPPLETVQL